MLGRDEGRLPYKGGRVKGTQRVKIKWTEKGEGRWRVKRSKWGQKDTRRNRAVCFQKKKKKIQRRKVLQVRGGKEKNL